MSQSIEDELVTSERACEIIGGIETPIHPSTLYRGVAAGRYPKPIRIGPGARRWIRHELLTAIGLAAAPTQAFQNMDETMPTKTTVFSDKFAEKGFLAHEVRFQTAIAEYLNNGGTIERAHQLLDLSDEGREASVADGVPEGRARNADAPRQNDDGEGFPRRADKAESPLPSPSSPERSAGLAYSADKATRLVPATANPRALASHVRAKSVPSARPSRATRVKRGAAQAVEADYRASLFDSIVLPDGRSLRSIQWHELPKLAAQYRSFSRMLERIHKWVVPADEFATVDMVIKESDLQQIANAVETLNDVA